MRVLHAPVEIAGQAGASVLGLRAIGVEAQLAAPRHPFGYRPSPDFVLEGGRVRYLTRAFRAARRCDVFHFHYGQSFVSGNRDVPLLRGTVVAEFHGSDVRMPSLEGARNPHYVAIPGEDDAQATARMERWAQLTGGHAIAADPQLDLFLARHFEHIHRVPLRIDVASLAPGGGGRGVLHAPSDVAAKGTVHVRAAVRALGLDYVEVRGAGRAELHEALTHADIVVDQLCLGSYGALAVEAMAMAKPVVCNVVHGDAPIVRADPTNIAAVLGDLAGEPARWRELGIAGRQYAERVHDAPVVARRLVEIYERLP